MLTLTLSCLPSFAPTTTTTMTTAGEIDELRKPAKRHVTGGGVGDASPSRLFPAVLSDEKIAVLRAEMMQAHSNGQLLKFVNFEVSESGKDALARVNHIGPKFVDLKTPNGDPAPAYATGENGIFGKRSWHWLSTHEYTVVNP